MPTCGRRGAGLTNATWTHATTTAASPTTRLRKAHPDRYRSNPFAEGTSHVPTLFRMRPLSALALLLSCPLAAQLSPTITSWILNPGGETGYNGIETNVLEVAYSTNNVWV